MKIINSLKIKNFKLKIRSQTGEIATILTQKLFGGSRGFGSSFFIREFKGDIRQKYSNKCQGKSNSRSSIGIPKINHIDYNFLSNKMVMNKQSVPSKISTVKTTQLNGACIPAKLGTMKTAPYQPAERLINNPDKDLLIAFLSFLLENKFTNANLTRKNFYVN